MTRQTQRVAALIPTSGFSSLDALASAMSAMGPARAKVVDLLKNEQNFEFVMNRKEDARAGIAAAGFLNQYEVGRSSGTYSPQMRTQAEAHFLGMTVDEYSKVPPRERAKYGYLRPAPASGLTQQDPAVAYGTDTFVFKRDAVKDHVTFWPTDTLGAALATTAPPARWDQAFLPWSQRMLIGPSLVINGTQLTRGNQYPPGFHASYGEAGYVELQYWRPLGLGDVERFEFVNTPPSGEFLSALRGSGVPIFKKGVATEWNEDHAAPVHVDPAPPPVGASSVAAKTAPPSVSDAPKPPMPAVAPAVPGGTPAPAPAPTPAAPIATPPIGAHAFWSVPRPRERSSQRAAA